jgi:hypothetical protein
MAEVAEEIGLEEGAELEMNFGSAPGTSTAPIVEHPSKP